MSTEKIINGGLTVLSLNVVNSFSATTIYGDGSNLTGISTQDTFVTGGTYINNNFIFTDNNGGNFVVPINVMTGLTIGGILSATTLYGDGSNLTGVIPTLNNGNIFVGSAGNEAQSITMTGDIRITNAGVTSIQSDVVTYDKIQDMTQIGMLGSTSISGGTVEEIPFIEAYLTSGSVNANLLEDTNNWGGTIYTGTTLTGTYQGQSHYDISYWFTAVDDNDWIRLIRG